MATLNPITTGLSSHHRALPLAAALLLGGCGLLEVIGIGRPPPLAEQLYRLVLTVEASADANPDARSRPSPVALRIFLTESGVDVAGHPLETIFELGGRTMAPTPRATLTLRPGMRRRLELDGRRTESKLTVAAAYRDPYRTRWIDSVTVDTVNGVAVTVHVTDVAVTIATGATASAARLARGALS